MNTRKKVKIIGTETYINEKTGKIEEMNVVSIEERDANFHKIWLNHIIQSVELLGNQKIKLAFWLIEQLDRENKITLTYRQIAEKSSISYKTVQRTMETLITCNFLVKINSGAYRVNPDVLFKGGKTDRLNILFKYQTEQAQNANDIYITKGVTNSESNTNTN